MMKFFQTWKDDGFGYAWYRFCNDSRFGRLRWWIAHRFVPWHRYHIIDTKLDPGYHEAEELMLYACFKVLEDSIEKEKVLEHFIWVPDPEEYARNPEMWDVKIRDGVEIKDLYDWWQGHKKWTDDHWSDCKDNYEFVDCNDGSGNSTMVKMADGPEKYTGEECRQIDEKRQAEETEMLVRLIKIRHLLWT